MRTLFCLFVIFFQCGTSFSLQFQNQYNQFGRTRLSKFKILGERCSGTTFISSLIEENCPELESTSKFGDKHFLWWFDFPINDSLLSRLNYTREDLSFTNSDDCLFVMIVRDPYDWVRSFYLAGHHISESLLEKDFSGFLSSTWEVTKGRMHPKHGDRELIDNYNPYTKAPFANILELRGYKLNNYLKVRTRVKNFCFVHYEEVAANPKGFIDFLEEEYQIRKKKNFVKIDSYQGKEKEPFVKKRYFVFNNHDLNFINNNLDWKMEEKVGYHLRTNVNYKHN